MQEQRGLIEQSLRGLDALHHDTAGQRMQARILFRGEFFTSKDHHWQVLYLGIVAEAFEDVEASHIRQAQVENHAIERILAHELQSFRAGRGYNDVNIVVAQQLPNGELLCRIVFYDQQSLATGSRIILDAQERLFEFAWIRRLGHEAKSPTS